MTVLHSFGGAWYCVNANDSTIVSLAKGRMAGAASSCGNRIVRRRDRSTPDHGRMSSRALGPF